MMEAKRRIEIIDSFKSTTCQCGASKRARQSHCSKCYYKLDEVLRASLYQPFGSGYEEAYERSLKVLQPPRFVPGKMTCGDGRVGNGWPSWRCTKCNAEFCNDGSTPTKCPRCSVEAFQ